MARRVVVSDKQYSQLASHAQRTRRALKRYQHQAQRDIGRGVPAADAHARARAGFEQLRARHEQRFQQNLRQVIGKKRGAAPANRAGSRSFLAG
jgi:protein subunit release factor B